MESDLDYFTVKLTLKNLWDISRDLVSGLPKPQNRTEPSQTCWLFDRTRWLADYPIYLSYGFYKLNLRG